MEKKFKFENNSIIIRKNIDTIELIIIEDDTFDKYHCLIELQSIMEQSKNLIKSIDIFYNLLSKKLEEIDGLEIDKMEKIITVKEGNAYFQLFFKFDIIFTPATRDEALKESISQIREKIMKVEKENEELKKVQVSLDEKLRLKQLEFSDLKLKTFTFMEKEETEETKKWKIECEELEKNTPIILCKHTGQPLIFPRNINFISLDMKSLSIAHTALMPCPLNYCWKDPSYQCELQLISMDQLLQFKKAKSLMYVELLNFNNLIVHLNFLPVDASIQSVRLSGNGHLRDITILSKFKNLKEFYIHNCPHITSLECLDQLPKLTSIIIQGTHNITNIVGFNERNPHIKITTC